jgi:hypothetical protein
MKAILRQTELLACLAALVHLAGTSRADDYQAHCLYLGEDPSGETNWSDAVRGIAHDDANWYIAEDEELWRVPVGLDLDSFGANTPGVLHRTPFPELFLGPATDWYFSDPSVFRFGGVDYLIVLYHVYNGSNVAGMAVLDADSLTGIDQAGWSYQGTNCGIDPLGDIYSNDTSGTAVLAKWTIDWPVLQQTGNLAVTFAGHVELYDENGVELAFLPGGMHGVEFTPDGRYLYIVADDIHIFDTQTWRRVHKSTNGPGFFPFQWDMGCLPPCEFPLGLTIWDLEGTPSPHIGQLHVVVRDRDQFDADDVFLKHYTCRIRVQPGAPPPWTGTPSDPFATVTAAVDAAWLGSEIRMDAATYDEAVTISKRVRLTSIGGTAQIGG